jgi:lauroyl/myristoyl acyltransferase
MIVCVLPHYLRGHVEAALLEVFSNRVLPDGRRGWYVEFSEPVELPGDREAAVADLTKQAVAKLEEFVARHPEQWHVFQPFWVADREPART